jgi:hypothetical protein
VSSFANIRPGDQVTIQVPAGRRTDGSIEWKRRKGRAVMVFPQHAVLNLGGHYGTPGVADSSNLVKVGKGRKSHAART